MNNVRFIDQIIGISLFTIGVYSQNLAIIGIVFVLKYLELSFLAFSDDEIFKEASEKLRTSGALSIDNIIHQIVGFGGLISSIILFWNYFPMLSVFIGVLLLRLYINANFKIWVNN